MSDDRSPLEAAIEQAMDAFVYAPIGLLLDGPELFPKLAERGRTQVRAARMMGEMAVKMGQSEAEKRLRGSQGPLRDALVAFGVVPSPAQPSPAATGRDVATDTGATAAPPPAPKRAAPRKAAARKATAKKAPARSAVDASGLAIPDYDSLSASQVVKRLQGMADVDLDAVRAYEAATRARKTILNRITQLQKG